MAKCSAHGKEIGTIVKLTKSFRYFEDGVILYNHGQGWKVWGKVKPEFTPQQAFDRANSRYVAHLAAHPCIAAYRKELHNLAGQDKRWKLHAAVQLLGDDYDGVWSEACDGYGDNVHADIDEVVHLCQLYASAQKEIQAAKAEA
jgi:hypothetical protein